MSNNFIIDKITDIELKKLVINPSDKEVLIMKIDIDKYDLNTANKLFYEVKKSLPEEVKVIGVPVGVDFEVDEIDNIIKHLEEQKK